MNSMGLQLLFCTFGIVGVIIKWAVIAVYVVLKTLLWRIPKVIYKWHKKRKTAKRVSREASQSIDRDSCRSHQRERDSITLESLSRTNWEASIFSSASSRRSSLNSLRVDAESSKQFANETKSERPKDVYSYLTL